MDTSASSTPGSVSVASGWEKRNEDPAPVASVALTRLRGVMLSMLSSIAGNRSRILLNFDCLTAPYLGLNCGYSFNDVYIDLAGPRFSATRSIASFQEIPCYSTCVYVWSQASYLAILKFYSLLIRLPTELSRNGALPEQPHQHKGNANNQQSEFHDKPNMLRE